MSKLDIRGIEINERWERLNIDEISDEKLTDIINKLECYSLSNLKFIIEKDVMDEFIKDIRNGLYNNKFDSTAFDIETEYKESYNIIYPKTKTFNTKEARSLLEKNGILYNETMDLIENLGNEVELKVQFSDYELYIDNEFVRYGDKRLEKLDCTKRSDIEEVCEALSAICSLEAAKFKNVWRSLLKDRYSPINIAQYIRHNLNMYIYEYNNKYINTQFEYKLK